MLRARLFLLVFVPFTLLTAASAIVATLFDSTGRLYHRHARFWSRFALWMAGVRVEVSGVENIPPGPVIFMSNHQSNFDILSLFRAIPQQFAWLAKEELFRIPVFGHSMARAGYIPLNRGDSRSALKSMTAAAERIKKGKSVIIFPEGTRSNDGSLLPFKRGGFIIAAKAGVPVVPCSISGSRLVNPPKRIELHRGVITIRFGAPITMAARTDADRQELLERVRSAIAAGLES
ncbi:MAG TPA: lysophospholipid acyltransferase family protein [Geobacteraceae bacterium]